MTTVLTIRAGVPEKAEAARWAAEVGAAHPDHHRTKDTAAAQIVGSLTMTLGGFDLFLCLDGGKLVGLLAYKVTEEPERIEQFNFAVLPNYQRRGIGSALLERVKGVASGRVPIFASGINDPAFGRLKKAGFWRAKDRSGGNVTYKWSDLQRHRNDDTPIAEEDD